MTILLRGGAETNDVRLDRVYELDWRSLNYPVTAHPKMRSTTPKPPRSYTWSIDAWLNQGAEGACVGFGFAHDLRARPSVVGGVSNQLARIFYHDAQKIDPWDGGSYPGASPFYEGTAVLSGAKVLTARGFYSSYTWALDIMQMIMGVGYAGPAIIGVNWHTNMFETDSQGFIHATGSVEGGHCILVQAVKVVRFPNSVDLDPTKTYFTLHNSWGKSWGVNGKAKISVKDMDFLLNSQGDVCFPVRTKKVSV